MTTPVTPAPAEPTRNQVYEDLASQAYDDEVISEVIRPAAVLSETAARRVLSELSLCDARAGGLWVADPSRWQRFDRPWDGTDGGCGTSHLLGSMQVVYGRPGRYEITIFRATITTAGASAGWNVETLCNEALAACGLTLANCPRAELTAPPKPFRQR